MTLRTLDNVMKFGVSKGWKYTYFAFDMGNDIHVKRALNGTCAPSTSPEWETILVKSKESWEQAIRERMGMTV